jgi:hypothetical protein
MEPEFLPQTARRVMKAAKDLTQSHILSPAKKFADIINGQAVLDEVRAYVSESEAINTALVTRLLRAESRVRVLSIAVAILTVAEVFHWILR